MKRDPLTDLYQLGERLARVRSTVQPGGGTASQWVSQMRGLGFRTRADLVDAYLGAIETIGTRILRLIPPDTKTILEAEETAK